MKTASATSGYPGAFLILVVLIAASIWVNCGRDRESPSGNSSTTNMMVEQRSSQDGAQLLTQEEHHRAIRASLARAARIAEERLRNPPTNEVPLPNFNSGPGRPRPIGTNLYSIDRRFSNYLLCQYDVHENRYSEGSEPVWIQKALVQVRDKGQGRFPPVQWVAVAVFNRADNRGATAASTFEQRFKVGAIFDAASVFDKSCDLAELVAHSRLDQQPFLFDQQKPTPGEQQRWVIVERHAATNRVTGGSVPP